MTATLPALDVLVICRTKPSENTGKPVFSWIKPCFFVNDVFSWIKPCFFVNEVHYYVVLFSIAYSAKELERRPLKAIFVSPVFLAQKKKNKPLLS